MEAAKISVFKWIMAATVAKGATAGLLFLELWLAGRRLQEQGLLPGATEPTERTPEQEAALEEALQEDIKNEESEPVKIPQTDEDLLALMRALQLEIEEEQPFIRYNANGLFPDETAQAFIEQASYDSMIDHSNAIQLFRRCLKRWAILNP